MVPLIESFADDFRYSKASGDYGPVKAIALEIVIMVGIPGLLFSFLAFAR